MPLINDDSVDLPSKRRQNGKAHRVLTALTDETAAHIYKLTRLGDTPDCVCDYLGISHTSFINWIRRGKAYVEGGEEPAEDRVYGDFYQNYRRAWASYRQHLRRSLHQSEDKSWIKWVTILERRDRKNYGRRDYPQANVSAIDPQAQYL